MMKLNLSLNDVENCKEKLRSLKKKILNIAYKQGLLFEEYKEPNKFRKSKTLKSIKDESCKFL